ncbi:MAG: sodium-dependent transporter [Schwartzia sp.]|nr:sodium-dependent transporter [Schwartzia sp. (in: firmicutes)]
MERFSSRLGFILISAGCAIGLGNVWRFPFITGRYGGASFVLIYLAFLVLLGLPVMIAEFAVGRASRRSVMTSFNELEPHGTLWHLYGYIALLGNFLLMMFYTTVAGWMPYYLFKTMAGGFDGLAPDGVAGVFGALLSDPVTMTVYMGVTVLLCGGVCYFGLQNGVEQAGKWIMSALFVLMILLAVNSIMLPGSGKGLAYYLLPDFSRLMQDGLISVINAAMGQAFFTLSLGIGALAIFGSYIGKEKSLLGEAVWITVLDTVVALMSGLIIFPACFSYDVSPAAGPTLIFIALPNVFNHMPLGVFWGSLFFLFMTFAAFSTVIAVFENLTSCMMECTGASRAKVVRWGIPVIILLSLPCVFGFNIWSSFQPLGPGSGVLDLEDFLLSNNILPIGSLVYILFCTSRYGWGWKSFFREVNEGNGMKLPKAVQLYMTWILPLIILWLFISGYVFS